jgi:hypothetical protein
MLANHCWKLRGPTDELTRTSADGSPSSSPDPWSGGGDRGGGKGGGGRGGGGNGGEGTGASGAGLPRGSDELVDSICLVGTPSPTELDELTTELRD